MTMKKIIFTLLSVIALIPAMAGNNVAPWGWATCLDEAGTAYTLNGGNFTDATTTTTLTALGGGQSDDARIKQAVAQYDVIILDGSNGDFTIEETMKIAAKDKTIIGINNARLCTKFYLTADDIAYLKAQNLESLSSTDQYTGILPDGTERTCDKRAFFTMKAMMELQYQKTGEYSLPNKAGIFRIDSSSENIIIRNLSLIGPGAVDIDGADLITNQGKHIWIDHCTFVDAQDGALDSKLCDWATYTYNNFYYTARSYSHAYTCGCGWAEGTMTLHLTFANNIWGEGCMRRLPQCDDCYVHLVNNYLNCPGNNAGMTIQERCNALVEGNYAAAGVNNPLTDSGEGSNVTSKDNSFGNSQIGNMVTVPYQYTKIAAADVPAALTGEEGAGATLGNNADDILSTIPAANRTVYVMQKDDAHIGGSINEVTGITVTFDPSVTDWKSGGSGSDAKTVDGVDLSGYYAQSDGTNGAPIILTTTKAGTLTIFIASKIATNKSVNMTEGENGLTGTVLSTGATIASGKKPATEIPAWDGIIYELEANKSYKFFVGGTKWRLAAFRYIASGDDTSVTLIPAKQYTTYVTTKALDFSNVSGLKAYIATGTNATTVTINEVSVVPAETPLLLITETTTPAAEGYAVPVAASAMAPDGNLLKAGDGTTVIGGSSNYDYVLKDGMFRRATEGAIKKGKAYLHLDVLPSNASELTIVFGNGTTSISEELRSQGHTLEERMNSEEFATAPVYNLAGQRVTNPSKGLYIVNGKKVVIK